METLYVLAALQAREAQIREFGTPEWQHRAAVLAGRETLRKRFMRRVRRLKLLGSESAMPAAAAGNS